MEAARSLPSQFEAKSNAAESHVRVKRHAFEPLPELIAIAEAHYIEQTEAALVHNTLVQEVLSIHAVSRTISDLHGIAETEVNTMQTCRAAYNPRRSSELADLWDKLLCWLIDRHAEVELAQATVEWNLEVSDA